MAEVEEDGRLIIYNPVWSSGTVQAPVVGSLAHPSCDAGTGTGWTGVLGTGSCFVSPNGHYQLLMQADGNLVLSKIDVTPAQVLWSTNTALTPLSLDVAFHTTYTYDPLGNLTGVSQANITGQANSGQARSYAYDGLSRLTISTTPESGTVTNSYTPLPGFTCGGSDPTLVCYTQDARGIVKNLTYDTFNRITAVRYSNISGGTDPFNTPPVAYGYDAGGAAVFALTRLTSITEGPATPTPVNSHTFTYDNLGRVTKDAQSIDQRPYNISYSYNLASEITSITYPSGRVVLQTYDAIGRLCSIGAAGSTCTSGTRYVSSLSFNAAGETLGLTMGNGVQGNFTYNDHLQLSTLRYFKSGQSTDILNLSYDYISAAQQYNNGQIQAMHYFTQPGAEDQTKSESFTYDQLGRLSAAQTLTLSSVSGSKTWSLQWTYDRFGNRLTQHANPGGDPTLLVGQPNLTVDPATNHITTSGYTYDLAGNMTNDAAAAYTYDGANRLTRINGTGPAYTYFGPQRIKKVIGSTSTYYIYSGSKVVAEYTKTNNNPTLSAEYIYAGSQLLTTIAGSTTTYHHPDHLSNRAESNSSGTRTRTFGQFPFGETWYETGTSDKWKFTGYERDALAGETGLDYANFRYYSSGLARFMSADLLGGHKILPQSLNRYAYTADPINKSDSLGLDDDPEDCELFPGPNCIRVEAWDPLSIPGVQSELGSTTTMPGSCPVGALSCDSWAPGPLDEIYNGWNGQWAVPLTGNIQPWDPRLRKLIWDILNGHNDCAKWFNQGIGSPTETLRTVRIERYATKDSLFSPPDGTTTSDPNTPIEVNIKGRFYANSQNQLLVGGVYAPGSLGARMVIILHELAHKIMPPGFTHDGDPLTDPQGILSEKNTQRVIENCQKAIDAATPK